VKPAESNSDVKKAQSDMINNYYTGPHCKKFEQHLAEIQQEIRTLMENKTCGPTGGEQSSEVKKELAKIRRDIRALRENTTSLSSGLSAGMKNHMAEIKQEIRALKENLTCCLGGKGLLSEMKQHLAEMKQEIRELKENLTRGPGTNDLLSYMKHQLAELKEEIRALRGNKTECPGGKVYKNCADVLKSGNKISGVYKIDPDSLGKFEVYCDQTTAGGGWTVFQRRQDGSVDFWRGWKDYKLGFGNLKGEFWLGLDNINRLTAGSSNKLRVDLEDNHGKTVFAEYSSFAVASERAKYQLSLGSYSGTAGDSLSYHRGLPFTSKDRDNDSWSKNCASSWKGAWWYKSCYNSNLNGLYLNGKSSPQGMAWMKWKNYISVNSSEMKIRPKNF